MKKVILLVLLVVAALAFWIVENETVLLAKVSPSKAELIECKTAQLMVVASEIDSGGQYRSEELAQVESNVQVNEKAVDFAVAMVIGNEKATKYKAKNSESAISTVTKKTMQPSAIDVDIGLQHTLRADMANGYERAAEIIEMTTESKANMKTETTMAVILIFPARSFAQNDTMMPVSNIYS